jgi:hypothetical protein
VATLAILFIFLNFHKMKKKKRGIFRDFFASFLNKIIKLATFRPSHFLSQTTWSSTFVKMLYSPLGTFKPYN